MIHPQGQCLLFIIGTGLGAGVAVTAITGVSFWTRTLTTELYETLTSKSFVAAVKERVGNTPVYTATQNYELVFYYGYALPIYGRQPISDMFGRGELPRRLPDRAPESRSPVFIILRQNEQFYLRPSERSCLRPVLAAGPGVFRSPVLFLMICADEFPAQPSLDMTEKSYIASRSHMSGRGSVQ